jgi:Phage protein Gp9.
MLRPIPSKILRSTAEVKVCTGTDIYQNQSYATYTVNHVHIQPTSRIVKSTDNTDQQLNSILFVDVRHSSPALDWRALLQQAHDNGGDMRVTVRGIQYTVVSCDGLRDDTDNLHHWEVGLY